MLAILTANLFSKIGSTVALVALCVALCAAGVGYHAVASARIATLQAQQVIYKQQTADLDAANKNLIAQMIEVKRAEDVAIASLMTARRQSDDAEQKLRALVAGGGTFDPTLLEQSINRQQKERLDTLQGNQ